MNAEEGSTPASPNGRHRQSDRRAGESNRNTAVITLAKRGGGRREATVSRSMKPKSVSTYRQDLRLFFTEHKLSK